MTWPKGANDYASLSWIRRHGLRFLLIPDTPTVLLLGGRVTASQEWSTAHHGDLFRHASLPYCLAADFGSIMGIVRNNLFLINRFGVETAHWRYRGSSNKEWTRYGLGWMNRVFSIAKINVHPGYFTPNF